MGNARSGSACNWASVPVCCQQLRPLAIYGLRTSWASCFLHTTDATTLAAATAESEGANTIRCRAPQGSEFSVGLHPCHPRPTHLHPDNPDEPITCSRHECGRLRSRDPCTIVPLRLLNTVYPYI